MISENLIIDYCNGLNRKAIRDKYHLTDYYYRVMENALNNRGIKRGKGICKKDIFLKNIDQQIEQFLCKKDFVEPENIVSNSVDSEDSDSVECEMEILSPEIPEQECLSLENNKTKLQKLTKSELRDILKDKKIKVGGFKNKIQLMERVLLLDDLEEILFSFFK